MLSLVVSAEVFEKERRVKTIKGFFGISIALLVLLETPHQGASASEKNAKQENIPSFVEGKDYGDPEKIVRIKQVAKKRMHIIEKRFKVKFDEGWVPYFMIGKTPNPADYKYGNWRGLYSSESGTISFRDNFMEDQPTDIFILDHELTHGLVNQITKRHLGYRWPRDDRESYSKPDLIVEEMVVWMVAEGVAEYVGHTIREDRYPVLEDAWPTQFEAPINNAVWNWMAYDGGYYFVKPILDQMGFEKGLLYLIKNPMQVRNGNFRKAIPAYWRKAKQITEQRAPSLRKLRGQQRKCCHRWLCLRSLRIFRH